MLKVKHVCLPTYPILRTVYSYNAKQLDYKEEIAKVKRNPPITVCLAAKSASLLEEILFQQKIIISYLPNFFKLC